ncbi:uncharacterized protein LOC120633430 [Pararge aegeria]|uniref:uncharacterized protein LOC120633430 n=1 Tax=Pararge aegeria TaxID=116150 RepID=UPI0019D0C2BB|nr:uncharacterized protein LOC120633430 [Pararge aegeria]
MTNSSEQLANSLEKSHGHRLCETKYSNNKVEGVRLSASSMELFNGAKKNDPLDSNSEPRILPAPVLKNNPSRANSQPRKRPFPSTYGSKINSQPSKIAKETISQTNYIRKSSIESGLMSSQKSQGLVDKVHLTPLVNIREVSPKVLNSTSTPKQNSIRSVATPFSKRTETSQGKQCSSANKHVKDANDRKSSLDQSGSTNFSKITKETSMMDVDGVKVISTSDTLGLTAKLHAHRVPLRDNKATSSYADASTENNSDLFSKNTVNKGKEVFEPLPFKEFRTMFGRKSCSDLKVANFSIYVTKLDKSVTEQDIRKYLLKYNINVIDGLLRRLRVTQRAMERALLRVSLRDKIRNEEIRKTTRFIDIAQWQVETGGANSSKNRWTLGFQGVGMATTQVNAALVGPQRG